MYEGTPALTDLVAHGVLDADLAALLWLLADAGVPMVVATVDGRAGERLRGSLGALTAGERATSDGVLPGGVVLGRSLEDVLRMSGTEGGDDVPDTARDLGVVVVIEPGGTGPHGHVTAAHYIRPVERDGAGHLQRRPPALLSAWDGRAERLDHFHWGVTDELATRAQMDPADFEREHHRRTRLLGDLAGAGVIDPADLRGRVDRARLVAGVAAGAASPDERH